MNAENFIEFKKISDVDKINWCSVFKELFAFHPGPSTRKNKLKFKQNSLDNMV